MKGNYENKWGRVRNELLIIFNLNIYIYIVAELEISERVSNNNNLLC